MQPACCSRASGVANLRHRRIKVPMPDPHLPVLSPPPPPFPQLYNYLKSRMMAVAPNLTVLVGELVGARLIAHVGSLVNLAKAPASTIQILGAEKALFR